MSVTSLLLAAVIAAPSDSLADQQAPKRRPSIEERKALVKRLRQEKSARESAARKARLRQRQYETGRRVRAAYNYQRRHAYDFAELAKRQMAYDVARRAGLIRVPSCSSRREVR